MLGITYHNPATISVFLDRMRFRECFVSTDEMRNGEWKRKLKSFTETPSDGRDRVVLIESFATLQMLVRQGAPLDHVKVAVYDDCDLLAKVPGVRIVDAYVNGSSTWQLYTVSFDEFNDALAEIPNGVADSIREHRVQENSDIPEQPKTKKKKTAEAKPVEDDDDDDVPDADDDDTDATDDDESLVIKQYLDSLEGEDEEDEPESEPEPDPAPAVESRPNPKPSIQAKPTENITVVARDESKSVPTDTKPARKRKKKPKPPKSYELF